MAGEAIKRLEEQLNCCICLDIYEDPKLLQCFHTYCRKCLVKLVARDQLGDLSLTCPICRQATPVPANGVTGLQSAFQTNEIREDLVKERDRAVSLEGSKVSATPLTSSTKKTIPNCFEHVDKERELYCETCEELICLKCALKGGKHNNHDYDEIKNAYERYKGEVRPSIEPMEGKLNTGKKALAQLDTRRGEVSDQREVIEDGIHNAIRELHQLLDIRKTELISVLHQITQAKLKDLATKRDEMETIQAQLSSCLDFVRKSLETESQGDVLMMKRNIVKQVKELITPIQPDTLKPNSEADMGFFSSPDVTTACCNYGKVYAAGDPDPSQCQATGRGLKTAVVGEKSKQYYSSIRCSPHVPFIGFISVHRCGSAGIQIKREEDDIEIEVPAGAVPEGASVNIEVGVSLYGPFQFESGRYPVSPILWICIQERTKLLKPMKIKLPHSLSTDDVGLTFAKAGHVSQTFGNKAYKFQDHVCGVDEKMQFEEANSSDTGYGILHTMHCCFYCLRPNSKVDYRFAAIRGYCLHVITERHPTEPTFIITFVCTYFLKTCLKVSL